MASLAILGFFGCFSLVAAGPLESNVIYGMKPAQSNGYGLVVIPGSGRHTPVGYGARPLKESKEFVEQDTVEKESAKVQAAVGAVTVSDAEAGGQGIEECAGCWSLMGGRVNWAGHAEEWFDAHLRK